MAKQNQTLWQGLQTALGFRLDKYDPVKLSIGSDDLSKLSPEEFETKRLEAQQTLYIQSQWKKIDNELYQKAVFYEPTRLASYYDYESMEFTPEISATLDIYMEEATTSNEETGQILNIYSESDSIREELEDLFYNKLSINTNLAPWIRNTVKYGDNFIYLMIMPKKGIIGVKQLPNIEITRTEPTFSKVASLADFGSEDGVKFFWKNKDLEFNSFEVAHFRLLGDDRKLPYGTSILEKARRIWKQLLMAEDAMLVYRISRAPERRVYKVFVGNMDDEDVDAYVDRVANEFKRTNMVQQENGNVDLRYNQMAVDQDFFIPIRDVNQSMPIETLPGAQNLAEIADIEYIQQKLFAALRIPKAFLGFEEAQGDGKSLAMLDIRFARAVHRVQQSIIQELNKIAILHLHAKGYEEDLNNFTLELNSPSTQSDLLKVERWREKISLYRDAVSDAGNGFSAMSMTKAKQDILGMSESEVVLDVQRQAIERSASEEIKILSEVIGQSGIFSDIYNIYNINPDTLEGADTSEERDGDVDAGGFSGGGGDDFADLGDDDFGGDEGGDDFSDADLNEKKRIMKNKSKKILKELVEGKNREINLNDVELFSLKRKKYASTNKSRLIENKKTNKKNITKDISFLNKNKFDEMIEQLSGLDDNHEN